MAGSGPGKGTGRIEQGGLFVQFGGAGGFRVGGVHWKIENGVSGMGPIAGW